MKNIFKFLTLILTASFIFVLGFINFKQYYVPDYQGDTNLEIIKQFKFLKRKIHDNSSTQMQEMYPEGFFFLNVIYGLTWTEILKNNMTNKDLRKEGISEIDFVLKQLNSEKGKEIFEENLPLAYGAYYQGWKNLLLAKKIAIRPEIERNEEEIVVFRQNSDKIARAYSQQESPFLESYPNGIWQCDNLICMASLAIHDQIFEPKYKTLRTSWLERIKQRLDKNTGLIAHCISPQKEAPRGSSQGLMLCYLPLIDSVFAQNQFELYKKHFLDTRLGLVAMREYPFGISGNGDIDSGPVIWDVGGVASIVGIKAFYENKDFKNAIALRNNIEGMTIPVSFYEKKYLLGKLPMVDVFVAWANAEKFDETIENTNQKWIFWAYSLIISIICLILGYFILKSFKKY